jgi:hypothetical protein
MVLASVTMGNAAPPIGTKINVNATTTAKICRNRAEKWTVLKRNGRKKALTTVLVFRKTDPSSKKMHFL